MQMDATRKLFTVDDYYKMLDAGILCEDDRVELIEGEIIEMSPMGSRHAAVVSSVTEALVSLFKGKALLRPQLPLRLNEFNEPEPDIAVVKPRPDRYSSRHPGPTDALLVIEISVSSLRYDRDVKLPIYAASQVPEVWIAHLRAATVLVYRDPAGTHYATHLKYGRGESLSCLAFPEIQVAIDDLLAL